jgi:hypothetical protein
MRPLLEPSPLACCKTTETAASVMRPGLSLVYFYGLLVARGEGRAPGRMYTGRGLN